MDIDIFKVEQWMNEYENDAIYNLGETCVDSLTIKELLELSGEDVNEYLLNLKDIRLSYGHIHGSKELIDGISSLYKNVDNADIIPTHGAIGANYQAIMTILKPEDNMVSVMPTYQQHYSIPKSIGTEVRILDLKYEDNFLVDIEKLKSLVDENTKLISINNPNNPTGSLIPDDMLKEIVDIAKSVDAYLLSDEVYRGISEDGKYMTSVVDLYDKAISVGSMSKIFSLAGLRLGWIVSKNKDFIKKSLERRDYDTISCGVLDDKLAALALKNKDKILKRNKIIIDRNRKILDDWVNSNDDVYYVKPKAGTTALLFYKKDIPSYEFAVRLIKEKGLLVTPGDRFEQEKCLRIGYAYDADKLKKGLEVLAEALKEF